MNRILDRLYLGAMSDLEGASPADLAPCTAVLTLCEAVPPRVLKGVHYALPDEVYLPIETWHTGILILTDWLMAGETVLVHCRLGVSRAPALVAAYLAFCGHSATPESALAYIHAIRPIVNVHPETWKGIHDWANAKLSYRAAFPMPSLPLRRWRPQSVVDPTTIQEDDARE